MFWSFWSNFTPQIVITRSILMRNCSNFPNFSSGVWMFRKCLLTSPLHSRLFTYFEQNSVFSSLLSKLVIKKLLTKSHQPLITTMHWEITDRSESWVLMTMCSNAELNWLMAACDHYLPLSAQPDQFHLSQSSPALLPLAPALHSDAGTTSATINPCLTHNVLCSTLFNYLNRLLSLTNFYSHLLFHLTTGFDHATSLETWHWTLALDPHLR